MFGIGRKHHGGQQGGAVLQPSADPFTVADVFPRKIDSLGREISEVYAKEKNYAVYLASVPHWQRIKLRMFVQYADDDATHAQQCKLVDDLLPLRDKLEYLCDDLRNAVFYQRRLATSLKLALDGRTDIAVQSLNALVDSATLERATVGRRTYLQTAVPIALGMAAILITLGGLLKHGAAHTGSVLLSGGGGAIGALLSIAIAFSNRSVAPDHDFHTNALDGGVRVLVGVISGVAFNLFLSAGFLTGIVPLGAQSGAMKSLPISWAAALALGLVAGFAERFMPDLITRFSAQQATQKQQEPAAAAAAAGAGAQGKAPPPPPQPASGDENLDGCGLRAGDAETTPDEHLPASSGGVA